MNNGNLNINWWLYIIPVIVVFAGYGLLLWFLLHKKKPDSVEQYFKDKQERYKKHPRTGI